LGIATAPPAPSVELTFTCPCTRIYG